MKLQDMKKEDLEVLSYNDIANIIITEEGTMPTLTLFTKIVDLLELKKYN